MIRRYVGATVLNAKRSYDRIPSYHSQKPKEMDQMRIGLKRSCAFLRATPCKFTVIQVTANRGRSTATFTELTD